MAVRQITDTKHFKLLRAIHVANGVPCEPYPELFFPEDVTDPETDPETEPVTEPVPDTDPVDNIVTAPVTLAV
jgi:hypothetical protein